MKVFQYIRLSNKLLYNYFAAFDILASMNKVQKYDRMIIQIK